MLAPSSVPFHCELEAVSRKRSSFDQPIPGVFGRGFKHPSLRASVSPNVLDMYQI